MQIALQDRGVTAWRLWQERPAGIRSFENWLLCWILLPNLGFWLLWIVGGPPRGLSILITGVIGVCVHRAPFPVKFGGFVAAMIFSGLFFVSALFNLSIISLMESLKFAAELETTASFEYLVCGGGVAATLVAAWWALRRPTTLVEPTRIVAAICLVLIAGWIDWAMTQGNRGSYKRTPDASAPFNSAVKETGLEGIATGKRHLVMVMVESMGLPADPTMRQRLVDLWAPREVRARYDVTSGDSLFYGSTTNGELRELCGRWAEYEPLLESRDAGCLPARLAARGYRSQAWHSFNGSFFDRTVWYPNIGFQKMRFAEDLLAAGAAPCPGVFPGACDRDVPRLIRAELKAAKGPQFLYWLTVNSHLPVLESGALHTTGCEGFDARLAEDYPMACRLMQLFGEAGANLAREISAADFPEADILIVGDHIPPFFDRSHREQFAPDSVPWILLRPKGAAASAAPPVRYASRG